MPPDMGEEKIYNTSMSKNNLAYTKKQIYFCSYSRYPKHINKIIVDCYMIN